MQSFSAWARWIATAILVVVGAIFTGVVFPVVSDFIKQQPQDSLKLLHAVLKFLQDLSEQTWLRITVSLLVGFVAGLWVDWLLRKLDRSRADERKNIGTDMVTLARNLSNLRDIHQGYPQIMSCFIAARKLGIWAPDQRIFNVPDKLIIDYLSNVGTMLWDGHFREAKQEAVQSKAAFDAVYATFDPRRVK